MIYTLSLTEESSYLGSEVCKKFTCIHEEKKKSNIGKDYRAGVANIIKIILEVSLKVIVNN